MEVFVARKIFFQYDYSHKYQHIKEIELLRKEIGK